MRLISLTVRNYRIHRETTVDFDSSLNLIGGTNETGKSTLAEAIHRALFFRHRSGGDIQKTMKSQFHNGHPEVQLVFEAKGATWTLDKRFSGTNGTARLSSSTGASFQGDAAEAELAQITGTPEGANNQKQLSTRWAHLWVWQGTAGDDAVVHTNHHRNELVQRLQDSGLAAIMQSANDERARGKITADHELIFTKTGVIKANSRIDLANKALTDATAALVHANEQKNRLESAIVEQETATKELDESVAALPAKRAELANANSLLLRVNELRHQQEKQELVVQQAVNHRKQLAAVDQNINELLRKAVAAREALVPAEEKLATLVSQESHARSAAQDAKLAHREISRSVRLARLHHELAVACHSRFEKAAIHEALVEKTQQIDEIQSSLSHEREALAKLPNISAADLDALRKLEIQLGQAESALKAIAAGVELVTSQQVVLLNGHALELGTPHIITETAELSLGNGTLLRIQPGGGTSLAESRRKQEQLQQKLTTAFDQFSVSNLAEAEEIVARRQDIAQKISAIEGQLKAYGAHKLPQDLAAATAALSAAAADVERRHAALTEVPAPALPDSIEAALIWQTNSHQTLQAEGDGESSLQANADATQENLQKKLEALDVQRTAIEADRKQLENFENSARALEQSHGDSVARAAAIAAATAAETNAQATFEASNEALAELNPTFLNQQVTRLSRVIAIEEEKQAAAHTRIAVARNTLVLDGTSDPESELLQAKARYAAAEEEQAREKRRASAIDLLQSLFSNAQSAVSETVTQPIADRVGGYLECMFGKGVRVSVELTDSEKSTISITRPNAHTFSFDSLSGGAKEQVAAAVRLATAEILAADHDSCLPILFDDAFAYADDDRIQSLQTMLDLAASRGLQIIVLTCTPGDYIGLGAKEKRLHPHHWNNNAPQVMAQSSIELEDAAE